MFMDTEWTCTNTEGTCMYTDWSGQYKCAYYTKKHRGGCMRVLLRPGSLITNRARSVRLVIRD